MLRALTALMFFTLAAGTTSAVTPQGASCGVRAEGDTRPRIGLVLGGGGARGFAHLSMLKELERQKIPVDCIAGTSMGALVGGLYASGMSAADIEAKMREVDWVSMFNDRLARPERSFRRKSDDELGLVPAKPGITREGLKFAPGVLSGQRILLLLEELTKPVATRTHFDDLPIPFRAVATDINTGQAAVLGDGNLALAMRASMSIPGVMTPVVREGQVLVDGGLANQVPVDVVRAMGADIIIAVDVGTPLAKLDDSASLFTIVEQISGFMTVGSARAQTDTLGPRDLLFAPPLGFDITTSDFGKLDEALAIGDRAVAELSPRLAALSLDAERFADTVAARPAPDATAPVIEFVRLNNLTTYDDAVLLAKLDIVVGEPLDTPKLQRNVHSIYGLGTLSLVTYDLVEEEGRNGVVVNVSPQSHGPNYLESGLSLYSDFSGDFEVNLRLGVLRAPANSAGGELRGLVQIGDESQLEAEYFQPLGPGSPYFSIVRAGFEEPVFSLFDDRGNRTARYTAPSTGAELTLGREFGNFGAATLSYERRNGRTELDLGDPIIDGLEYDVGVAELLFTLDRIDNRFLPRAGTFATAGYRVSRESLGADSAYEQGEFTWLQAQAIGRHSGFTGLRYGDSSDDVVPLPDLFRLGGITRFAGYRPTERFADNYALAYAGYTYELGRVVSRAAVLGGTLEYGYIWGQDQSLGDAEGELHGSIYFGFDSWLGPLQLGYGLREGGEGIFLLEFGRLR
jgi:NTE family protein